MRLSTKGRYAVMAMADLAGNATDAQSPGDPRPVALADALELEKGEPIEWVGEDRNTLALKRPAKAPTKRRRSGGSR